MVRTDGPGKCSYPHYRQPLLSVAVQDYFLVAFILSLSTRTAGSTRAAEVRAGLPAAAWGLELNGHGDPSAFKDMTPWKGRGCTRPGTFQPQIFLAVRQRVPSK